MGRPSQRKDYSDPYILKSLMAEARDGKEWKTDLFIKWVKGAKLKELAELRGCSVENIRRILAHERKRYDIHPIKMQEQKRHEDVFTLLKEIGGEDRLVTKATLTFKRAFQLQLLEGLDGGYILAASRTDALMCIANAGPKTQALWMKAGKLYLEKHPEEEESVGRFREFQDKVFAMYKSGSSLSILHVLLSLKANYNIDSVDKMLSDLPKAMVTGDRKLTGYDEAVCEDIYRHFLTEKYGVNSKTLAVVHRPKQMVYVHPGITPAQIKQLTGRYISERYGLKLAKAGELGHSGITYILIAEDENGEQSVHSVLQRRTAVRARKHEPNGVCGGAGTVDNQV